MEDIVSVWEDIGLKLNKIAEGINGKADKELNKEDSCNFYNQVYGVADLINKKVTEVMNESQDVQADTSALRKMPVPIKEIARCLHIHIGETQLPQDLENSQRGYRRRITYLKKIKDYEPFLFIDPEAAEEEVRYAIAFGIGQYMSYYQEHSEEDIAGQEYTLIPMLSKDAKSLVADALAIALLVPFNDFMDSFNEYINMARDHKELPIRTEGWLEYLSGKAGISFCNMAIGYQQLRYVVLARQEEILGKYSGLFMD